jgi:hypothetical protein
MRLRSSILGILPLVWMASANVASASTTMVRLGYAKCTACHLAPQGAGLLSDYGKGIDLAQSLRTGEYAPPDPSENRWFRYDLRVLTSTYSTEDSPTGNKSVPPSWLRTYWRNSFAMGANNRIATSLVVEAPVGDVSRLWETRPSVELLGAYEYSPSTAFTLAVARDRLPRGVELGETRTILQEGDTDRYPAQVRAFVSKGPMHVTAYGYAPGGELARDRHAVGAGVLGEFHMSGGHFVLGASARRAFEQSVTGEQKLDRQIYGGYVRMGFGQWGVLAEHEYADRTVVSSQQPTPNRYAGYTQFFVVPKEWLVMSLIGEQSIDDASPKARQFRWRPEVQARISPNLTITASYRTDMVRGVPGSSRIFLVQFAMKTVQ